MVAQHKLLSIRRIACICAREARAPKSLGGGDTGGTATVVSANAFSLNINFSNKNRSIKAGT